MLPINRRHCVTGTTIQCPDLDGNHHEPPILTITILILCASVMCVVLPYLLLVLPFPLFPDWNEAFIRTGGLGAEKL